MPTYQYACTECSHSFEQFQTFSDDTLTECPQCAGRLRKLFNAVGVVFKGSGFYRNDSRSTAPSSEAAPSPSEKSGKSDKSEKSASPEKSTATTPSEKSTTGASTSTTAAS